MRNIVWYSHTLVNTVLTNLICLLGLILVTLLFANRYVSQETYFYYADLSHYSSKTEILTDAFRVSLSQGFSQLYQSFNADYSDFPCLLLVPLYRLWGESRQVFILGLTLLYLVPFSLIMGAIAAKIFVKPDRVIFWLTAFLTPLIPTVWIANLRGYPDIGGAVLIGLALLICLQDLRLSKPWQAPSIGVLMALAILFRRHFAYSARALLITLFVQGFLLLWQYRRENLRTARQQFLRYFLQCSLVVLTSVITLALLAPEFIGRVLTTSYRILYSSYEFPLSVTLPYYANLFGWLLWIMAILGYTFGLWCKTLRQALTLFLLLFFVISLLQWIFLAKAVGSHYGHHFTGGVVIGIAALVWTLFQALPARFNSLASLIVLLLLISNAIASLLPLASPFAEFGAHFVQANPPLLRPDYANFSALIRYLREVAKDGGAVYVAGDSGIMHSDLIEQGEKQLYGRANKRLRLLLKAPMVDSRDAYPLQSLLQAQYLVLATPMQGNLPPQEHDVIQVVLNLFQESQAFAQHFQQLPRIFVLANDVQVKIYRRITPITPETILSTYRYMQKYMQSPPGGETFWLMTTHPDRGEIKAISAQTTELKLTLQSQPSTLLYLRNFTPSAILKGNLQDTSCSQILLSATGLTDQAIRGKTEHLIFDSSNHRSFMITLPNRLEDYLQLDLNSSELQVGSSCDAHIMMTFSE
jgi:hypothetical protein